MKQLDFYLTVDKPAVSEHKATMAKVRSAMTEVVQDIISSSLLTRKSTNLNQVNEVMYQIERFMGQADLSRYVLIMSYCEFYISTCSMPAAIPSFTHFTPILRSLLNSLTYSPTLSYN